MESKIPESNGQRKDKFLEVGLLVVAILCFAAFSFGAIQVKSFTNVSNPVAVILEGDARIKHRGSLKLQYAPTGTKLYNRDALWTTKNQRVIIQFQDSSTLELSEHTLLVVKKPFRTDRKLESTDRMSLIHGRVKASTFVLSID